MDYTKLSKEISYALRHAPWEYELELDEEGFVPVEQLIHALNESGEYKETITKDDILHIIKISEKKRHELKDGKNTGFVRSHRTLTHQKRARCAA